MELTDQSYKNWLETIKRKIKTAQMKVAVTANSQVVGLYWELAKEIIENSMMHNGAMQFWSSYPLI